MAKKAGEQFAGENLGDPPEAATAPEAPAPAAPAPVAAAPDYVVRCRGCGNKWYGPNQVCPACAQTDPKRIS